MGSQSSRGKRRPDCAGASRLAPWHVQPASQSNNRRQPPPQCFSKEGREGGGALGQASSGQTSRVSVTSSQANKMPFLLSRFLQPPPTSAGYTREPHGLGQGPIEERPGEPPIKERRARDKRDFYGTVILTEPVSSHCFLLLYKEKVILKKSPPCV